MSLGIVNLIHPLKKDPLNFSSNDLAILDNYFLILYFIGLYFILLRVDHEMIVVLSQFWSGLERGNA